MADLNCKLSTTNLQDIELQAYLVDIAGLVPDLCNKVSHNLFVSGESCLQFVKNVTSVKCNKAKSSKMNYVCTHTTVR